MKYILLFCALLLSGCATLFDAPKFPEATPELLKKCEQLEVIENPEIVLSELIKTVVKNYQKYHNCAILVESWQDWYNQQKKIFDSAND